MEYVYVLSNPSMPGLVKIGMTTRSDINDRVKELDSATGIPTPFKVEGVINTMNAESLEQYLHEYFSEYRVSTSREFFNLEPNDVLMMDKSFEAKVENVELKSQIKELKNIITEQEEQIEELEQENNNYEENNQDYESIINFINDITELQLIFDKNIEKLEVSHEIEMLCSKQKDKIIDLEWELDALFKVRKHDYYMSDENEKFDDLYKKIKNLIDSNNHYKDNNYDLVVENEKYKIKLLKSKVSQCKNYLESYKFKELEFEILRLKGILEKSYETEKDLRQYLKALNEKIKTNNIEKTPVLINSYSSSDMKNSTITKISRMNNF